MVEPSLLRLVYGLAFAGATLACLVAVFPAREVDHEEVRDGLVALLVTVGSWAATETVRVFVRDATVGATLYVVGLAFGLAAVGAWLYFAAAYTGYRFHRDRRVRLGAAAGFVALMAVKVWNPAGLYYSVAAVSTPFAHVAVTPGILHWVLYGLAYVLAAFGFYLLYDTLRELDHQTTALGVLTALTAAPVVLTLLGALTDLLPSFSYEPLGVAVFAIGTLYVTRTSFLRVTRVGRQRLPDHLDDPVFVVDSRGLLRDWNDRAAELVPGVSDGVAFESLAAEAGLPFLGRLPESTPEDETRHADGGLVEWAGDHDEPRYFDPTSLPLSLGAVTVGQVLVLRDVTETERQRRRLVGRDETLEDLTVAIGHEFRNALTIVNGYNELGREALASGDRAMTERAFERIDETSRRAASVVEDLETLARYASRVDDTEPCRLSEHLRFARDHLDERVEVATTADGTLLANEQVFQHVLRRCLRFCVQNGASLVELRLTETGFVLTDDGDPLSDAALTDASSFDVTSTGSEFGTALPTARALAMAQGWTLRAEPATEGVRLVLEGARTELDAPSESGPPEQTGEREATDTTEE